MLLIPIEESTTLCIYPAKLMTLPFGESRWDNLPDLVKKYIEYFVDISLHRDRMKRVCKSIKLFKQWCNQQIWMMEVVYFDYFDISLFRPYFIESQECNKCFKTFSPEVDLSKPICRLPTIHDFIRDTTVS